jgi:hypothetical protein
LNSGLTTLTPLTLSGPAITHYQLSKTTLRPRSSLVGVNSSIVPLDLGTLTNFKDFILDEVTKAVPDGQFCMTLSRDENYAVGEEFTNWAQWPFWITSERGRDHAVEEYANGQWDDVCDMGQHLKWEDCLPVVIIADTLWPEDLAAIEDGKDVLLDGYLITDIDLTENIPVVHINPKKEKS